MTDADSQHGKIHNWLLAFVLNQIEEKKKRLILLETVYISPNLSACPHHRAKLIEEASQNVKKKKNEYNVIIVYILNNIMLVYQN